MTLPAAYPRRILVAVSGLSPAILTETLYALATDSERPFIPTEIHLITTLEGKERATNSLLKGADAAFTRLCEEYQLPGITFNADCIHVITDGEGKPLSDIRLPGDNQRAADFIVDTIRGFTADDESAVHVSIAGGRKTMGYYVGYALSLLGREQDRMSHVLVDSDYERCRSFFYPTKKPVVNINSDGKHIDFSEAKVHLAEIPFVCMRTYLPRSVLKKDALITGKRSFSEVVKLAQPDQRVKALEINPENQILKVNGLEFKWTAGTVNLAFYIWMIMETVIKGKRLACPPDIGDESGKPYGEKAYGESLHEVYDRFFDGMSDRSSKAMQNGMTFHYFSERKSRVNKELKSQLGEVLGGLLEIRSASSENFVDVSETDVTLIDPSF
ncbi:MAG: TIGR02584 family CRISPR-associated protein [Gammaproteobacteria bacterium]|nr:MAG: TIGR02584 family CRISPR-associated protein [Pseudomonadota bacterium]PIE38692.1 MAG: TIGR02584 family CRISPR-associated protein [Gammaproteobacteria bacterium]